MMNLEQCPAQSEYPVNVSSGQLLALSWRRLGQYLVHFEHLKYLSNVLNSLELEKNPKYPNYKYLIVDNLQVIFTPTWRSMWAKVTWYFVWKNGKHNFWQTWYLVLKFFISIVSARESPLWNAKTVNHSDLLHTQFHRHFSKIVENPEAIEILYLKTGMCKETK